MMREGRKDNSSRCSCHLSKSEEELEETRKC